ncbi:hypothetical protein [Defluviimonas salinarum]|uniref:Transglycosylase SLT domain-containing protein n=1 Tax=Defluviimonas salinarum TaxID=2992147 RepID=A0ABT3J5H2_9RHOB|nr:hypothetical protein [Defluviimonas salinarum]MCW3782906.1 hypothetical protein [Defluviimonas salinarum]
MIRAVLLAAAFLAASPAGVAAGDGRFAANDVDFLNLIGNREGYRGYGTVSDYAPAIPDEVLTGMTISEVLDFQQGLLDQGTRSTAVGRYQFIRETLLRLVEEHGIGRDLLFDEEIQTYLARILMRDCGFYDPEAGIVPLGNCLAGTWAALPMLSGPKAGLSAYHGDGLNHHAVAVETFATVLDTRFLW